DRQQIGWEERPRTVVDLRHRRADVVAHAQLLIFRNADVVAFDLDVDTELLEHVADCIQVLRHAVFDQQFAARDDGESDVRTDFDVIAGDGEVAAVQRVDSVNGERVRGDSFDLGAEQIQKSTEVLNVRLGGGVVDDRVAFSEGRGHDGVLGGGD